MKFAKKLLSLVLVVLTIMSLTTMSFAQGNGRNNVNNFNNYKKNYIYLKYNLNDPEGEYAETVAMTENGTVENLVMVKKYLGKCDLFIDDDEAEKLDFNLLGYDYELHGVKVKIEEREYPSGSGNYFYFITLKASDYNPEYPYVDLMFRDRIDNQKFCCCVSVNPDVRSSRRQVVDVTANIAKTSSKVYTANVSIDSEYPVVAATIKTNKGEKITNWMVKDFEFDSLLLPSFNTVKFSQEFNKFQSFEMWVTLLNGKTYYATFVDGDFTSAFESVD